MKLIQTYQFVLIKAVEAALIVVVGFSMRVIHSKTLTDLVIDFFL